MTVFQPVCQPPDLSGYTNSLVVGTPTVIQPGINAAPAPVFFRAGTVANCDTPGPSGTVYDPRFHDLYYVWSFGDPANAVPANASNLMVLAQWKNVNIGYGPNPCHVYNTHGTYTVTLTVYEPSSRKKGSVTVDVTIGDPKVAFPGTRTIIYNPGGAFNITPYGYVGPQVITSTNFADVIAARTNSGVGAQNAQILLVPGVEENFTSYITNNPAWANIRMGALDMALTKPILRRTGFSEELMIRQQNSLAVERWIFGTRWEGPYDSAREQGPVVRPFSSNNAGDGGAFTFLAGEHNCEFDGWEAVAAATGDATPYTLYHVHSQVDVTNWQNYGLHGSQSGESHTAVIACRAAQHPDALSGGGKDVGWYNNHGPLRDFGSKTISIDVVDFFTRNGWSTGGTGIDGVGIAADQACIRINTNGRDDVKAYVSRAMLEGMVWIEEQDSTKIDRPGNYVFDKFVQVMSPRTIIAAFNAKHGGETIRNGLGVLLAGPKQATTNHTSKWIGPTNNFGMDPEDDNYAIEETKEAENDVRFMAFCNTLLDLRSNSDANNVTLIDIDTSGAENFSDMVVENNIMHQPNRSPALVPFAPVSLATLTGITGRHRGWKYNFLDENGTLGAEVAVNAYFTLSYANVKTTRYNQSRDDSSGVATSKAYWDAACPAHPAARHKMVMAGATLFADNSQFEVVFDPAEIRVYNRTAAPWAAGASWSLMLDRYLQLPAWNPTYSTVGATVPFVALDPASPGKGTATGRRPYDDILGRPRPAVGDDKGCLLTIV
jgi:hypothetical protein